MRTGKLFHPNSQTFLIHLFGRGLDANRYVVERYPSHANGDMRPVHAEE